MFLNHYLVPLYIEDYMVYLLTGQEFCKINMFAAGRMHLLPLLPGGLSVVQLKALKHCQCLVGVLEGQRNAVLIPNILPDSIISSCDQILKRGME